MARPLSTSTPNEAERGRSLSLGITENAKNTMDIMLMQTQGIGPPLVFVFKIAESKYIHNEGRRRNFIE